jgi:hypothetical protein
VVRTSAKKATRILSFILALGFLVWLLDRIGWDTIGGAFARVGWTGAGILLVVGVAENIFHAAALDVTFRPGVGLWRLLSINGAGTLINALIPWEAGEVFKGALLRRHAPSQEIIHGLVIWNFLLKLSGPSAALFATLLAFALGHGIDPGIALLVLAANIVAFAPYLGLRLLLRQGMASLVVRVLRRIRIAKGDPAKLLRDAGELDQKIRAFRTDRPRDFWKILGWQFLARLSAWTSWYVVLWLMGLEYSFALCAMIFSGYAVAVYVTAFIPAKIGVNEGTGYVLFVLYGLDGGVGLIATVIGRVKNLATNGIAGLFAFAFAGGPRTLRQATGKSDNLTAKEEQS